MQLHEHYNQQRFTITPLLKMAQNAKKYNLILCYAAANHKEEDRRYTLAKLLLTIACPSVVADIPPDFIRFEIEQALLLSSILSEDVTTFEGRLTYPITETHR